MTRTTQIKAIQTALGIPADGIAGAVTWNAIYGHIVQPNGKQLHGDGTWPWYATIIGDDIVVENATATCFGGSNDPQDSGKTASGVLTKGNDKLVAVSLPMDYRGPHAPTRAALQGSPLPMLPWQTMVEVTSGGVTITAPVIDLGPAKYTGNAIDLTIGAARKFKPGATATNFKMKCSFRIIGGAKFVK